MLEEINNRGFEMEFVFATSRSSGPGGQNVNKVNTKVELRFDVINSSILSVDEKEVVFDKLHKKISIEGFLIITNQSERSQLKNKELAIAKFYDLIIYALTPEKPRKKTKPSKAAKEKRLEEKQKKSTKKNLRRKPDIE